MLKSAQAKSILALLAAAASFAAIGSANAETIRDHRTVEVRDHRVLCVIGDPNCRDHRGPAVVVPPRDMPPVVVIDTPHQPMPPLDPGMGNGHWNDDEDEDYVISCGQGRRIVRENGFRHVRAFDCEGRIYGYRAENRTGGAKIRMSNQGEIISVQYYAY